MFIIFIIKSTTYRTSVASLFSACSLSGATWPGTNAVHDEAGMTFSFSLQLIVTALPLWLTTWYGPILQVLFGSPFLVSCSSQNPHEPVRYWVESSCLSLAFAAA